MIIRMGGACIKRARVKGPELPAVKKHSSGHPSLHLTAEEHRRFIDDALNNLNFSGFKVSLPGRKVSLSEADITKIQEVLEQELSQDDRDKLDEALANVRTHRRGTNRVSVVPICRSIPENLESETYINKKQGSLWSTIQDGVSVGSSRKSSRNSQDETALGAARSTSFRAVDLLEEVSQYVLAETKHNKRTSEMKTMKCKQCKQSNDLEVAEGQPGSSEELLGTTTIVDSDEFRVLADLSPLPSEIQKESTPFHPERRDTLMYY